MATCKDCICYEILCQHALSDDELELCQHFKNKADYAEVKHGEWKPTKIPSYFGGVIYQCALCGAKDGDHTKILGRYCWRCGAKMDGGNK